MFNSRSRFSQFGSDASFMDVNDVDAWMHPSIVCAYMGAKLVKAVHCNGERLVCPAGAHLNIQASLARGEATALANMLVAVYCSLFPTGRKTVLRFALLCSRPAFRFASYVTTPTVCIPSSPLTRPYLHPPELTSDIPYLI